MAARTSYQASQATGDEQRPCSRGDWCEARTRDADGAWHPAQTYQPYCQPCTDRIVACAAELPPLYGYLHAGGAPARSGRPVRVAPGSRVLVSPPVDAYLRACAAVTGGWAARVRGVMSLSHPGPAHGTPERVREDCRALAANPSVLLALADGPTVRAYPWPLTPAEEARLADCEIVRIGEDWVHVIEQLDGAIAGAEILDLDYRARKLAGQVPAPPDMLDGIPCRSCEGMSSLELVPAPPPDPAKPAPPFSRCSIVSCRDEMTRAEYDSWVRQYNAWVEGGGVLTCHRCADLGDHANCCWPQCSCAASGHRAAA